MRRTFGDGHLEIRLDGDWLNMDESDRAFVCGIADQVERHFATPKEEPTPSFGARLLRALRNARDERRAG